MPGRKSIKKSAKEKARPEKRPIEGGPEGYAVILFADIVGCSEISNHKNLTQYNEFLTEFHNCFKTVCKHYKDEEYKETEHPFFKYDTRGDEGCIMIFTSNGDESLAKNIDIIINIALELKRKWLFTKDNIERIEKDGLLPVDLGIGIHAGKVYINEDRPNDYRPEGYAINLTKRIESESRGGKFTHILVSESAQDQLYNLKDESIYKFDKSFPISPKGISREIKVFEIKHHFLPTDWYDMPSEVSIIYEELDDKKLETAKIAYKANPTNLWLAEEYVLLSLMNEYQKLSERGQEDDLNARKNAYKQAYEVARHIAGTDLRDAGILGIWGFVCGEQGNYKEEQRLYEDAILIDKQDGDIHWWLAYSWSRQLYEDEIEDKKEISVDKIYRDHKEGIGKILKGYEKALELTPMNAWIIYDYACELSWWSQVEKDFKKDAIEKLIKAFNYNANTKERAKDEPYLGPLIEDSKIKKVLKKPE